MAEQVTEIAYIPLKAGLDLESGEGKSVWESALATIAKQPGAKKLYWGKQIESPDVLQLVVEWEAFDNYKAFTITPDYPPFIEALVAHIFRPDAPLTMMHAKIPPASDSSAPNPLTAPVTECINAYFPASQSEAEYNENFAAFHAKATKIPNSEAKGLTGGWSIKPHQHESLGEGVEGKMFAAFIGWPSVEAHMAFRKTEEFGTVVPLLRGGTKAIKAHHVKFTQYK